MSDLHATTPRVFLARHGETEWTKTGQYTGISDIPLTDSGRQQVSSTARVLVGPGKLVDPLALAHVFVSPRVHARDTFKLLFAAEDGNVDIPNEKVTTTEQIAEWNYGLYEGILVADIKKGRKERGLDQDKSFSVWSDGCEDGGSPKDITIRLDSLIQTIKGVHEPHMSGSSNGNVILIAHGLILRACVKRWLGYSVDADLEFMLSPGGIGA